MSTSDLRTDGLGVPCIGSSNLPYRGTRHVQLCQTDLAAQIWPCLPSKPNSLLRSRQMIVDFKWDGIVVWSCVPSRFSLLDTRRTRLLRLDSGRIDVLFQPGACELTLASNPLPEGKSRSQTFHRIPPARASSLVPR